MQYYDKKAVGRRIKQLRKSKGLTQHGLAGLLDYTGSRQLQRIETGETSCTVEKTDGDCTGTGNQYGFSSIWEGKG